MEEITAYQFLYRKTKHTFSNDD